MSIELIQLLVFWAALAALAYIGWVDVLIPDVLTIPAAFVGLALSYVSNPVAMGHAALAVVAGCVIPLTVDLLLFLRGSPVRLGPGVMKGCGMVGAYLNVTGTIVAMAIAALLSLVLLFPLRMRVVPMGIPIAIGGFAASLVRLLVGM